MLARSAARLAMARARRSGKREKLCGVPMAALEPEVAKNVGTGQKVRWRS